MRKRTWLVDSLWKEADIAEVSAEVVRLTKQIRKSCRQDKRNRIDRLCEEMEEASRNRDGKKVWECARAVAGTGLGLKRRVFQPPDEVPITAQEWDEYMKDTFRAQLSPPLGPQPSKGCVLGQLPPSHEFFNTIEYSKNNKTVADGDVPAIHLASNSTEHYTDITSRISHHRGVLETSRAEGEKKHA